MFGYLRRLAAYYGHGIHSPFAYDFMENVVRSHTRLYAQDDLSLTLSRMPAKLKRPYLIPEEKHIARLAGRIVRRFAPSSIAVVGEKVGRLAALVSRVSPSAELYVREDNPSFLPFLDVALPSGYVGEMRDVVDFLIYAPSADISGEERLPEPGENSILMLIDRSRALDRNAIFSHYRDRPDATLSFDLMEVGLVFFSPKLNKQHIRALLYR